MYCFLIFLSDEVAEQTFICLINSQTTLKKYFNRGSLIKYQPLCLNWFWSFGHSPGNKNENFYGPIFSVGYIALINRLLFLSKINK